MIRIKAFFALFSALILCGCAANEASDLSSSTEQHNYSDEWSYDPTFHWHQCTDNGFEDLQVGKEPHSFDKKVVEPDYEHGGYTIYTCQICGFWTQAEQTDPLVPVEPEATLEKLEFTLSQNEESYSVKAKDRDIDGSVVIPSRYNHLPVVTIEEKGFEDCRLTSVYIPASIETILDDAFAWCYQLRIAKFASDVPPKIGSNVFGGAWNHSNFMILVPKNAVDAYKAIDGGSWDYYAVSHIFGYSKDGNVDGIDEDGFISEYIGGKKVLTAYVGESDDIVIPSYCDEIGDEAFAENETIQYVFVGSHVSSVGARAFAGTYSLKSITFESSNPPVIGSDVFAGTWNRDLASFQIRVPNDGLEAYKSIQAPYWQEYAVDNIVGY